MNEIIKKFEEIRDIPYSIPLSAEETDHCCRGKSTILRNFLESKWYKVNYRICKFKWSDTQIPKEIFKWTNDDCTHVYLEVEVNWKIINVDPTWDTWLSGVLPIATWDWESSTEIAVKSLWLFSVEESEKIMKEVSKENIINDLKINWEFYKAFNKYLESIRNKT